MSSKRTSARLRSAARKRMEKTGEKYTVALAAVLLDAKRGITPQHHSPVVRPFEDESAVIDFAADRHLAILGTSGSGKTKLAELIIRDLRDQGVTVLAAVDTHISNAVLAAEHVKNVATATQVMSDRRDAHARRDPLFLVLDRANYLDDEPEWGETTSLIRALIADGGEYNIHVIVVQQSAVMSSMKNMLSDFDLRVVMGNVASNWYDRELRTDGVTSPGAGHRLGIYEDADANVHAVTAKEVPFTIITGKPGYGFTVRAVEKMRARFPGESIEQIHARLVAEVEGESIEQSGEMTKELIRAAAEVASKVGSFLLEDQLETMREVLAHSGVERARELIEQARPTLSYTSAQTLDSLVLSPGDERRESCTSTALNQIEHAIHSINVEAIPDHLRERMSSVLLGGDGLSRSRVSGVPSARKSMDEVFQIVSGALDADNEHVYLWSRDLGDFSELLEHYDGAEREEGSLGSLLASARTHGEERVVVVIDHQGVLGHRSAGLLSALSYERRDIEIIYVERPFVDAHRRSVTTASARDLIATRLAPAQFGVFGAADEIIRVLRTQGVSILRDQTYSVRPFSEGSDNLAKSYVRDVIRLALIERGLRADSYNIELHADAVIESLVATGLVSFPEGMLTPVIAVNPMGSSADISTVLGGTVANINDVPLGPLAIFPYAIDENGETLDFDASEPTPHQTIIGLSGTGSLKSPDYDSLFGRGRVVPLDISHGEKLRAETKTYTGQNLPFITLNTGVGRRKDTRQAIRDYGVTTLVVGERFDDYEDPLVVFVHPDNLTAEIIDSPNIGYYVIDNVERAVEDPNGMALITSLIRSARQKGRAVRLLQESEGDVPAAIDRAVTKRIISEGSYGIIKPGGAGISMDGDVYAHVFDDETGIDFTHESHLLVSGGAGSGKSVLLRQIAKKMRARGFGVNIVDPRFHGREYGVQEDRSVSQIIEHVHGIMLDRFAELKERRLPHAREAGNMPPVFMFVDYADQLFDEGRDAENFGSAEEAEVAAARIREILRVSRAASVHLVVSQSRVSSASRIASGESRLNYGHRILMGRSTRDDREMMFRHPGLPGGLDGVEGIYQDAENNIRRIRVLPPSESN